MKRGPKKKPAAEKKTALVIVHVREETRADLAMMARTDRRSVSAYTRKVLEDHVEGGK